MRAPVLIVGSDSRIGAALFAHLRGAGQPAVGTSRRPEGTLHLDLARTATFSGAVATRCQQAVLCAGATGVDALEADPQARKINVTGTIELLRQLTAAGTFCWFLSTNTVFDGSIPAPHAKAATSPQTLYGRMKNDVEQFILQQCSGRAAIVRLTKVLGSDWKLGRQAVTAARARGTFDAFHDWRFSPILLSDTVDAIARLMEQRTPRNPPIFHFSASDTISYAEGFRCLYELAGAGPELVHERSIHDTRNVVWSPRHTTLDCSWEAVHLGWRPCSSAENLQNWFSTEHQAAR